MLNKVYFPNFANRYILNLSWPFSCDYSFWLFWLKFGMCIKDPINKRYWKNGKDLSNGAPKIKLWNHAKKTHFPVLAKNFRRPWMMFKKFFCHFPNPWTLRVSGMGGYTSKCEKSQNHCTLLTILKQGIAWLKIKLFVVVMLLNKQVHLGSIGHNLMGFTCKKMPKNILRNICKKVFQFVEPFLANLYFTSFKKYSYTVCTQWAPFFFLFLQMSIQNTQNFTLISN